MIRIPHARDGRTGFIAARNANIFARLAEGITSKRRLPNPQRKSS